MKTINLSFQSCLSKRQSFTACFLAFACVAFHRQAIAQCNPGFAFDPPPPGTCDIVADPFAPDGTFDIWHWGDGSLNNGTGGNQSHTYDECGIFNIVHVIQCDQNGDGVLENVPSDPVPVTIIIPVVNITTSVTNPMPSCNETSTITYTLCRQPCQGLDLPIGGSVTLSVFMPQGLEVGGQTNFLWTATLPGSLIQLSPACASVSLTVRTMTAAPPDPNTSYNLTMFPSSTLECIDFDPDFVTTQLTPQAPLLIVAKTTSTPNVQPNGIAQFTVTVQNQGSVAASNVEIKDKFPSGFVPVSLPSGATIASNVMTIPVASIPANGNVSFNLSFKVTTLCADNLVNEAWVLHPACDFESEHVTASVSINTNGVSIINFPGGNVTDIPGWSSTMNQVFIRVQGDLEHVWDFVQNLLSA